MEREIINDCVPCTLCAVIVFPVKGSFLFESECFHAKGRCCLVTERASEYSRLKSVPRSLYYLQSPGVHPPPSDTKRIKQKCNKSPGPQRWLVVKDGSVLLSDQLQICAFYEEAEHILRSKFHCWKRKLGWAHGQSVLSSSPRPSYKLRVDPGIVFRILRFRRVTETQRISRKYLTSRLGALSVQSWYSW